MNVSKAIPKDTIPVKIVQNNSDIMTDILCNNFNNFIYSSEFPNYLKLADVSPIYKDGERVIKTNYRPISNLPAISKLYEKPLFRQIYEYFSPELSKFQCGFRSGYGTQYCLLLLLEKWKKSIDSKGSAGILLTDLSKAFDCLSHDLLIAKLAAYGFHYDALKLVYSYLSLRNQKVRINSTYSTWSEIISGVPQGSIVNAR